MTRRIRKNGLELKIHGTYGEVGTVFSVNSLISPIPTQLYYAPVLFNLARPLTTKELTYVKSVANKRNHVYTTGNHVHEGAVYNPKTEEVILARDSPLILSSDSFIKEIVARERSQDSEKKYLAWSKLKRTALREEKKAPHERTCHLVKNMELYTNLEGQLIVPIEEDAQNPELSFLYEEPPEKLLELFKSRGLDSVGLDLFGSQGGEFNYKRQYKKEAPLFDRRQYSTPFIRNLWITGHTKNYLDISSHFDTKGYGDALGCFYWRTRLKPEELGEIIRSFEANKEKPSCSLDVERLLWVIPTMFGRTIAIQKVADLPKSIRREFSKFGTHHRVSFYKGKERPHLQDYHATYYVGDNDQNPLENLAEPDNLTLPTNKPEDVPSTGDILITLPQGLIYLGRNAYFVSREKKELDRQELQKVKNTFKHWK
ncbi:MAG: hypothetical protein KKF46_05630 [Nanoarchaeota archaeon]|nr:hypothetical protein [Nanoarchaeota archaeon]MBU1321813.1 hypothetical protein [Nanoarchaeota archaeon]MBU1598260.1 hypothetical protein [Nanoarchaeota archaeon]MBU2441711.1 hypothetical protein [Nanoarchaeota archaeon]